MISFHRFTLYLRLAQGTSFWGLVRHSLEGCRLRLKLKSMWLAIGKAGGTGTRNDQNLVCSCLSPWWREYSSEAKALYHRAKLSTWLPQKSEKLKENAGQSRVITGLAAASHQQAKLADQQWRVCTTKWLLLPFCHKGESPLCLTLNRNTEEWRFWGM